MKIEQVGPSIIQLTRFPRFFPISCFFVVEDDGLTLIDTGMAGSAKAIMRAATRIGRPITRIALTHSHADHAGSLDELRDLLPDAEIAVSGREARLLAGDRALESDEGASRLRGSYLRARTTPDRLIEHGDRVGSLRVVDASGHTPGQVAFYDDRDGSLLAGDAFQTKGGIAVAGKVRWRFPFPALATWDKSVALETAYRLLELEPKRLAVGHGPVLANPRPEMARAIADAERAWGLEPLRVA